MPLIILGLIVIIGIVIYALIIYGRSGEKDTRTVRERYPHVFEKMDRMKKGANYTVVDDEDSSQNENKAASSDGGHTLYFPDDAEVEKRKRNIH
jgi:hypothetical protein